MKKDNTKLHDSIPKKALKGILFSLARHPFIGVVLGVTFQHFSRFLPLGHLINDKNVIAFEHPSGFWEEHLVLVPKKAMRSFLDINFQSQEQTNVVLTLFIIAQQLIVRRKILAKLGNFCLVMNCGSFQVVPQLHFHIGAGRLASGGGINPNTYCPQKGNVIIENDSCTISQNAKPRRSIDLIVSPKVKPAVSFLNVDFETDQKVMAGALATVQAELRQRSLPGFSLIIYESDIRNSGSFCFRIVAGKTLNPSATS